MFEFYLFFYWFFLLLSTTLLTLQIQIHVCISKFQYDYRSPNLYISHHLKTSKLRVLHLSTFLLINFHAFKLPHLKLSYFFRFVSFFHTPTIPQFQTPELFFKGQMTKNSTFFILAQFWWNMFNMNRINILWSFSSIEASISEIFAIKNCYFLTLIFVERSGKLSEKTACDVNVGQVKKSGKFKTVFRVDLAWKWFVRP